MQLARLMPSIGRLPSVRPSKALPLALGAHAASPAGSGAWVGAGGAAAARRSARRLHTAAAASQEQLAKQPRDNEDAQPTTIADPGQNPLFWPFVVRRACATGCEPQGSRVGQGRGYRTLQPRAMACMLATSYLCRSSTRHIRQPVAITHHVACIRIPTRRWAPLSWRTAWSWRPSPAAGERASSGLVRLPPAFGRPCLLGSCAACSQRCL